MYKNKSSLVLSYHIMNSKRIGGFHSFIRFLYEEGYNVDWVNTTLSSSWVFRQNDKENISNFVDLLKGIDKRIENTEIRHFGVPVWTPAKITKIVNKKLYNAYVPNWKRLRRRLRDHYDIILIESTCAVSYATKIKKDYPDARIIYRPSDVLTTITDGDKDVIAKYDKKMVEIADKTLVVDDNCLSYYKTHGYEVKNMFILRNPIVKDEWLDVFKTYKVKLPQKKQAVFLGVSGFNVKLIEYAAAKNNDADFLIIGPHKNKSFSNIKYLGSMQENEFEAILDNAGVGLGLDVSPDIKIGYTGKIIRYMTRLMPIVAMNHDNYMNISGFICVDNKDSFSHEISKCLEYTPMERERLRDGYKNVMKTFSEYECRKEFLNFVCNE